MRGGLFHFSIREQASPVGHPLHSRDKIAQAVARYKADPSLTINQLAKENACVPTTVRLWLKDANVPIRRQRLPRFAEDQELPASGLVHVSVSIDRDTHDQLLHRAIKANKSYSEMLLLAVEFGLEDME